MEDIQTDNDEVPVYSFEDRTFESYQDMVAAKRRRNQEMLEKIGLHEARDLVRQSATKNQNSKRGIALKKKPIVHPLTKRRKSSRLAGVDADGRYIEDERGGKFTIVGSTDKGKVSDKNPSSQDVDDKENCYNGRINNGEVITIKEAVGLCGDKWITDVSYNEAESFFTEHLSGCVTSEKSCISSPTCLNADRQKFENISINDSQNVAKITPERIYATACHPSSKSLIVTAGDKLGHVGIWHTDNPMSDTGSDGVHLFRPHSRPICCLQWNSSGTGLLSASYDGSVRWLDVESQTFAQIFATFDASEKFKSEAGYALDEGRSWMQYCVGDLRSNPDKCFFFCTSSGKALHIDLRTKEKVTFMEVLSEKKINTVSLHPDGNSLASAGLDCMVKLWDLRKFDEKRRSSGDGKKSPTVVSQFNAGKSINSAFFSPSGKKLLLTTMADTLEIFVDSHQASGKLEPKHRINHNNRTGRWLSTFMATWHANLDLFVVGSMQQPRSVEVYDGDGNIVRLLQGNALTAVASRCCFHPSPEKIIVIGGNSSGRVCIS